jgi:hypothetical protein
VLEKLRDPVWGGISAIVAIIALLIVFLPEREKCEEPIYETVTDAEVCGELEEELVIEPAVAKRCRKPEFGIERYTQTEVVTQTSGWVKGGSNQTNWCNQMISSFISARGIGANAVSSVTDKGEDARWTGWHGRDREYKYDCTATVKWAPIHNEQQHESCGFTNPVIEIKKTPKTCQKQTGVKTVECPS